MPDDFYSQQTGDDAAGSPDAGDESGPEDSNTALVPNSFFGDEEKDVGDECRVRIVHRYDDETEIAYEGHDKERSESPNMDEAEKGFDAMTTKEA